MGSQAQNMFASFTFGDAADTNKYNVVLGKFDPHFIPKKNIIHERAKFGQPVQKTGEC